MKVISSRPTRQTKKVFVELTYEDSATAGLTKQITVYTMSDGEFIKSVWFDVQTAWDGGATVTASLGESVDADGVLSAQDVKTTGLKTTKGVLATTDYLVLVSGTNIVVEFISTVNNLDTATQGSLNLNFILESN